VEKNTAYRVLTGNCGKQMMDWIYLAQDRDKWWVLVKIVMHPLVP
jgi:hypothetical protein